MCIPWIFFRMCAAWICVLSCFCAFVRARCGCVRVFVWVCVCARVDGGGAGGCLCAVLLRVSNSSVFNEISNFLLFFFFSIVHFLPALRGAEFIRTRFFFFFPFSLYSAVHKLLLSHFCAAGNALERVIVIQFQISLGWSTMQWNLNMLDRVTCYSAWL